MHILYPDIKPYRSQMLAVTDSHSLYLEESGNPEGIPVLFVHGGPGGGCGKQDRCFFDPERYRIILFDQRGAGRSTPHASLEDNSTDKLLSDMEAIREALGVERWLLFGGSWGATLSLAYAQQHAKRVMGMILRGIFLCRQQDIDWFYRHGASLVFPDYWEDFIHPIPESERSNLVEAYYQRLTGSNELAKMACAKAWSLWEAHCATLRPSVDVVESYTDPHSALAMARIEAHYFMHRGFIEENQILANADALEGIPGIIVHGRYDMICPLDNAQALHQVWHDSQLHIIRDAGHSSREPSIIDALVRATRSMARRFADDCA
ncbi:prolyl aminopeptidase [Pseudomaricurvus alkylphenolicus]|jgi:proline iminopeptidase|uniref:prolyl aminopeptidase n=1 Tax=Pseudomaricurvus alkylphenolicus TaxID=1306991 RepID=UPI0014215EF9|nr:prolyl aminopeptidase [Pseudomaricurvus alkylphenolicus]NIB39369.1 prolyl aminopeptidase [Pseudomaricurvus alkylphenolicus]